MIPRREGRTTGSGGGGRALFSTTTPFCCKRCGRSVNGNQMMEGVDVCRRCRVKPSPRKPQKKRK
jgi:hypothetical protein